MYAATTKDDGYATDGRFSKARNDLAWHSHKAIKEGGDSTEGRRDLWLLKEASVRIILCKAGMTDSKEA